MKFTFPQAKQAGQRLPVIPVFMPFAGCRVRCVFCSQTAQTGKNERQLSAILAELNAQLKEYEDRGQGPVEVAFYGGTFTALPLEDQLRCLELTSHWQTKGVVAKVRCSTRPDCIHEAGVEFLQRHGVSLVELGVQSFSNEALRISQRNYTAECVVQACKTLKGQGLELGIQLMPGLPGASLTDAYNDIDLAVEQKPSCARLYPCLVFAETPLAHMWKTGGYEPLPLDAAVDVLAYACLVFGEENIPIIRMGVAPEPSATEQFLAGPCHPSLGNMARSKALFEYIASQIALFRGQSPEDFGAHGLRASLRTGGLKTAGLETDMTAGSIADLRAEVLTTAGSGDGLGAGLGAGSGAGLVGDELESADSKTGELLKLSVPQSYQGDFWGFKGQFKKGYAALGLKEVVFVDAHEFCLERVNS